MTDETKSRLLRVAKDDLHMPLSLLAERFGMSSKAVARILQAAGVSRAATYYSRSINKRGKMA